MQNNDEEDETTRNAILSKRIEAWKVFGEM